MPIDVRKLLSGETNKITLDYDFSLDSEDFSLDTSIDGVVFNKPAHIGGEIINMGGYIRLSAAVSIEYDAECARCLKPLKRFFEVSFERTVVNSGELVNTPEDQADDYIEIVDGLLCLDEMAAEQLMMEFPMKELCSEDCKGLCSKCGKDLNEGDCSCPKKEIDPRLAVLQKLLEK